MNICRLPILLCGAVTLIGSLCAAIGDWSAAGVYGVIFTGIVAYFVALYWVEDRPRMKRAKLERQR